ncbi:D-serine deaminase, pyridoxal phosphate-dependent [Ekhidna lutea]|uniref:D-serine deaminase, pyridoxal phosphate-dependent n=1 Tax=Ekhidna lutea TaxID=447679 RepID=A0A239ERV8_EKHLU|nr:alanine racemase [Ekhidna lutea]SNS47375.1 D-serine deaminase, pyridoxal phosphate-dependent [Ekhidna lutea]
MEIKTPTLIIDKGKALKNIQKMSDKAKKSKAELRPHFKTHFSAEIGNLFKAEGISKCTVSSVSMAKYFAAHGWTDITIAFPYNLLEVGDINALAGKINLNILLESEESLEHAQKNIKNPFGYFIKIDVGTHRTGIDPRNGSLIERLVKGASGKSAFIGFLAHAGHTYGCRDFESIKWIFDGSVKVLSELKNKFGGIISYGDTPSCSIMDDFSFADELRPGNFVFYDFMQHRIGSCSIDEIALCLASPVVAIHKERNEVVVYGGAVHLSKEMIKEKNIFGKEHSCYGKMVTLSGDGWETTVLGNVERLSQEHGIIKLSDEEIARVKVGDVIGILPVHSCLTADLQGHYLSTKGERIEKMTK